MGHVSKKNKTSAGRLFGRSVIYGADDGKETAYMTRYWIGRLRFHIFHRGDQDPDCHDHPWGFWTFPFRSYVEEVVIPNKCPTCGLTMGGCGQCGDMLKPAFIKRRQIVRAWRWSYRPATHTHRVIGPWKKGWFEAGNMQYPEGAFTRPLAGEQPMAEAGVIPTLVWRERPSRKWGFLKARDGRWCWVHWKEYVYAGGKAAPCSEPDYMTLPVEEYDTLFGTNGGE